MQTSQLTAPARVSTFNLTDCVRRIAEHQPLTESDTRDLMLSTISNVGNTLAVISDSLGNPQRVSDDQNTRETIAFCASVLECTALISSLTEIEK